MIAPGAYVMNSPSRMKKPQISPQSLTRWAKSACMCGPLASPLYHRHNWILLFWHNLQEIHSLKAQLEAAKYDVIKYCIGTIVSISAVGLAVLRIVMWTRTHVLSFTHLSMEATKRIVPILFLVFSMGAKLGQGNAVTSVREWKSSSRPVR